MQVSISDVAKKAAVSISTVSRVVNRRELVNPKTRARVEEAIRALGYRPNAFARGLMLRKSEILGLVLPDLHGEFYSEVIRGANRRAHELGYNLLIFSVGDGEEGKSVFAKIHQRTIMDGIVVMVSELVDHAAADVAALNVPFVALDGDIEGTPHDSVLIDQQRGAEKLATHLVQNRDVRRLIFIGGHETNVDTIARRAACRRIFAKAGCPVADPDIYHLDYEYETAYQLAVERIASWVGQGSCVFAANDEMAAGVIAAANARGVRVPDDLAIVGFDDTRIARMTRPMLTTIHVPMAEMGAEAVEVLCHRLATPDAASKRISLEPELIVRESCGR